MSIAIINSVFIPIPSGKPDRNNPAKRTIQKGAMDDRCLHYAMNIIRPMRGDPHYRETMREKEKALTTLSRRIHLVDTATRLNLYEQFFKTYLKKEKIDLFSTSIKMYYASQHGMNPHTIEIAPDIIEGSDDYQDINNIMVLYFNEVLKTYRDTFDLKISKYQNENDIAFLIKTLKDNGPMLVIGNYGSPYYNTPAIQVTDPVVPQDVFGWTNSSSYQKDDPIAHCVVICGASITRDSKSKIHERVYFVDPIDTSDPTIEKHRKVYVMSFKKFREQIAPYTSNDINALDLIYGVHRTQ